MAAHLISRVSAHGETTGRRSASYLAAPWCPSAAASSSCSLCCELTRECVTSSDHGPRGLVASPLRSNAPIPSGPSARRTRSRDAVGVGPRPEKHDLRVAEAEGVRKGLRPCWPMNLPRKIPQGDVAARRTTGLQKCIESVDGRAQRSSFWCPIPVILQVTVTLVPGGDVGSRQRVLTAVAPRQKITVSYLDFDKEVI